MALPFRNRAEAGRFLVEHLREYANDPEVVVLALPRGGVPVAVEVARKLRAPLDVYLVRKLGVPGREELAMGAVATGGVRVLNEDVIAALRIDEATLDRVTALELSEIERRERVYRDGREPVDVRGKTVILVDDGLATGSTMLAAVRSLRQMRPRHLVVAVPTGAATSCLRLHGGVDRIICATTPEPFEAVGLWYQDFTQVTDQEVRALLASVPGHSRDVEEVR